MKQKNEKIGEIVGFAFQKDEEWLVPNTAVGESAKRTPDIQISGRNPSKRCRNRGRRPSYRFQNRRKTLRSVDVGYWLVRGNHLLLRKAFPETPTFVLFTGPEKKAPRPNFLIR